MKIEGGNRCDRFFVAILLESLIGEFEAAIGVVLLFAFRIPLVKPLFGKIPSNYKLGCYQPILNRITAQTLLLEVLNSPNEISARGDRFVVSSAELSPNADWVIRANSQAYVKQGDISRSYVGVNAYLIESI